MQVYQHQFHVAAEFPQYLAASPAGRSQGIGIRRHRHAPKRWKRFAMKNGLSHDPESIGPTVKWLTSRLENLSPQREISELRGLIGDVDKHSEEVENLWRTACTEMTRSIVIDAIAHNSHDFPHSLKLAQATTGLSKQSRPSPLT